MRNAVIPAVLVPALTVALAGCDMLRSTGGSGGGTGVTVNAPVSIGIAPPENLVPGNTVDPAGLQVLDALFTPLVTVRDGMTRMAAARSVSSTDARVWTITLADGYTFADGQKVTAESYVRAWNYTAYGPNGQRGADLFSRIAGYDRMQSPDGKARPRETKLSGVRQTGDTTIQVTLAKPYAQFPALLASHAFDPLPDAAFGPNGTLATGYATAPVGDGPYKLREGTTVAGSGTGGTITVVRAGGYPGPGPKLDRIDFKIYKDPDEAYRDLTNGTLDVLPQVPSSSLGRAQAALGPRLQRTRSAYLAYLAVPAGAPATKNVELRKAISMAIDRRAIAKKIFLDTYRPAGSWSSPVVAGGRDDSCGDACRFDAAGAKRRYEAAGGLPGGTLRIYYNADGGHREWVDEVCRQLHTNLGLDCSGTPLPLEQLTGRNAHHDLSGLVSDAWSVDYPALEDYLGPLYRTGAAHNGSGYHDPAFDRLLDKGDAAKTWDDALSAYRQAEDLLATAMPAIPLWSRDTVSARSTRMAALPVDATGTVDVAALATT